MKREFNEGYINFTEINSFIIIHHLYIHHQYRKRGFGTKFLNDIQNEFSKALILECHPRLLQFYKKLGFHIEDRLEDGYYEMVRKKII